MPSSSKSSLFFSFYFIQHLKSQHRSFLTIKNYHADIKAFLKWFESFNNYHFSPHKITPTDIEEYKDYLLLQQYKPTTINRKLLSLKYFLRRVWQNNKSSKSFGLPDLLECPVKLPNCLDTAQQETLLLQLENHQNKRNIAIIKFLLHTGLKVSELCQLKWSDIIINADNSYIKIGSDVNNKRVMPLNKQAQEILLAMRYEDNKDRNYAVFIGQRGPLTIRAIQLICQNLLNTAPYNLRHSFCKNLVNTGIGVKDIALLMGHESLKTTKRYHKS